MSYFIIIRGPLGSGKTTVSKKLTSSLHAEYISIDALLDEYYLTNDKEDGYVSQTSFKKVNGIVVERARNLLESKTPIIFDGNFYWKSQIEDLVERLNYPHFIFTLKAPLEMCIKRDSKRDNPHGPDAVKVVYSKTIECNYDTEIDATKSIDEIIKNMLSEISNKFAINDRDRYMIIDCHTHIGFKEPLKASPRSLLESMKKAGIDAACVYAGELNGCSTEKLLEEISSYPNLYPIGSLSPLSPTRPLLDTVDEWFASKKIYGLKFYPGYEYFYPYDECVRPYLELLTKHDRPAIFHSGDTYSKVQSAKLKYAHPFHIDELASEMPDLKIIIAHFGNPWFRDTAEVCFKNTNVYSDCSGFVYNTFLDRDKRMFQEALETFKDYSLVHTFGRFKLLFGTDWPISDQLDYMKFTDELFSSSQQRGAFFSQNAVKVFGLKNT